MFKVIKERFAVIWKRGLNIGRRRIYSEIVG